jgi:hypothetical protein
MITTTAQYDHHLSQFYAILPLILEEVNFFNDTTNFKQTKHVIVTLIYPATLNEIIDLVSLFLIENYIGLQSCLLLHVLMCTQATSNRRHSLILSTLYSIKLHFCGQFLMLITNLKSKFYSTRT